MSDTVRESTWLLTEHLRYTPLTLIDDIINSVNALLYRAVSAVETGLLNAPPTSLGFKLANDGSISRRRHRHPDGLKGSGSHRIVEDQREQTMKDSERDFDGGMDLSPSRASDALAAEAKVEIENGVHQLETLFEATVDKDFDKLEIYVLRNILAIPDEVVNWIKLGHYENLDFSSDHPDEPTLDSLNLLRRKLQETQKLHRVLVQESRRNAALIEQLSMLLGSPPSSSSNQDIKNEATVEQGPDAARNNPSGEGTSPLAFLTAHPIAKSLSIGQATTSQKPLTTSTAFVASQLKSLRALLTSLRPQLVPLASSLNNTATRTATDQEHHPTSSSSAAQVERAQYIESQTRRHLVNTQRIQLDEEEGALDDGQSPCAERRIQPDELRHLEHLLQLLRDTRETSTAPTVADAHADTAAAHEV